MPRRTSEFQTILSEGGLLPPDLLRRVVDPTTKVPDAVMRDLAKTMLKVNWKQIPVPSCEALVAKRIAKLAAAWLNRRRATVHERGAVAKVVGEADEAERGIGARAVSG